MYFSNFPKIYYDFPQDDSSTVLQVLTDITANVRVRKQVLENITIYDEYDIQDGETPEIIAEKAYGNAELHWLIMLVNQRYDYLKDFPMTSYELQEYVLQTYGADNINNYHHYEKDNVIVDGLATLKIPKSAINQIKVYDFIRYDPIASGRVESINLISSTVNVLMSYGRFKDGDLVNLYGIRKDDVTDKSVFTGILNFNLPTNCFTVVDGYFPITNSEHETIQNEKKRRIKLISRQLVDQVVTEFRALIKP